MSIQILINSVDRTSDIEQESVRYSSNLTKAPGRLSFSIKGNKSLPTLGQDILVKEDGINVFKGVLTNREDQVIGNRIIAYDFECMDGYFELNRRLISKAYNNTDAGTVVADIITSFTTGFTTDIPASTPSIETIRFNYEQPANAIQKIANAIGWDWYVDADYVVHFFEPDTDLAPYEINDSDGNLDWKTLEFDRNIIELKNVVFVRGGTYDDPIAEGDAVDKYIAQANQIGFPLVYQYGDVEVTVDNVAQTVGVDFLDDPASFDCLYNFQEKSVKFPDGTFSGGEVVRVFGNAKVPIIVQISDQDSILAYGRQEAIEINKSINSIEEAELLALSLLDKWREGSKEGSFKTKKTGWRVGQAITINTTLFGVNEVYKVNRIYGQISGDIFQYEIEFIKSGQTTLSDILVGLIGKEKDNVVISPDEVIQIFDSVNDDFSIADEITETTQDSPPYHYSPVTSGNQGKWDFATWS